MSVVCGGMGAGSSRGREKLFFFFFFFAHPLAPQLQASVNSESRGYE